MLLLEVVGLVEVLGVGEADDGDLLGVSDGEVAVEGFFEVEGIGGEIFYGEPEVEFDAEGELEDEGEVVVAEGAGGVVGGEGEGEVEVVSGEGGEGEGPVGGAGEAVGGAVGSRVFRGGGACSEPGKDEGDATADGLAGLVEGAVGEEEHGVLAGGLPLREVCSLQVELGRAGGRGDVGAEEAVLVLGESEDAGDRELVGEILEIHWNSVVRSCESLGSKRRRVGGRARSGKVEESALVRVGIR